MMLEMITRRVAAAAAALSIVLPGIALADYPDRPIRLLVPNVPGGAGDIIARSLQEPLAKALGQPIVIENKAGASGAIAAAEVARAPGDGYTLLLGNNGPVVTVPLLQKSGYTYESFSPIGLIATTPLFLLAHPSLPAKDMSEFVKHAKSNPDGINFGIVGGTAYLITELISTSASIKGVKVLYKGQAPALAALLSNEIQVALNPPSDLMSEYIKTGKLKVLGVTSAVESAAAPGVQPIAQVVPGIDTDVWFGLFGPKSLPPDVVTKIKTALDAAIISPNVQRRLMESKLVPAAISSEPLPRKVSREAATWTRLISERGIKFE